MEFFKIKRDIPFMSYARLTTFISLVTFLAAIVFLFTRGLNLGVDFTGGTVMDISYPVPVNIEQVRSELTQNGYADAAVQFFGSAREVTIRLPLKAQQSSAKLSEGVASVLKKGNAGVEVKRVDFVGPQVGKELLSNGLLALLVTSLGIIIYLSARFEWRFAISGVIANLHDVVIILGMFAFFQWEFSLPVLAAVLAVLGYSVNESVIVFDRIRENFRKMRQASTQEVINNAITRTMSRTIITHAMTQTMVCAMLFFGGDALHYFALALTIGILFGIYSSVLVASPLVMWFGVSRANLVKPPKKEVGAQV